MTLQKKDFIEIEFTGKTKEGEIFDSNIKEDLQKANLNLEPKPFIFCLGEGMFLQSVDDFLIGKEIGGYKLELEPEKAFGKRNAKLIQMIPSKIFREHKTNPVQGATFNFDGRPGKILSVSGGRILVDFNNPIAGKDVIYHIKVVRKLENQDEKIKSLVEFLFRRDFKFEVKDTLKGTPNEGARTSNEASKKLILHVDKGFKQFVELFHEKFKDILNLDLEAVEPAPLGVPQSTELGGKEKKKEKEIAKESQDKENLNNKDN